ncbi:MAG: glycosyltransferase [Pasteurellaceae bacterium]|nr:glycosyltransferase [Pasteurellaceae bacterium]
MNYDPLKLLSNGLCRLLGNIIKIVSYGFHALFPRKRFTIPEFRPATFPSHTPRRIRKTLWQTNYSNNVTLPVYCNYLCNRLFSLSYEYRYVSTEARDEYIKTHGDERTYHAYSQLTDGAAQADFWRVFVMYQEGGVYLDIDAHLVWPLASTIGEDDREIVIRRHGQYTNFFLASEKGNVLFKTTLDIIIDNIEQRRVENGVFHLTGPVTLSQAIDKHQITGRHDKLICAQGTFTNEYFQYMDKKRGKWTYAKNEELLK